MHSILENKHQTLQKSIGALKRIKFIPSNGCNIIIIITLFLFITNSVCAASYYVSNSGNDSNLGKTPETAWKTIKKVNNSKFLPGDLILLKAGNSFDGPLNISNSGTSKSPITISKYGNGGKPIINGDHPNAIWSAVIGHTGVYESSIDAPSIQKLYDKNNNLYKKKVRGEEPLDTWLNSFSAGDWGFTYSPEKIYLRTLDGSFPTQMRLIEWSTVRIQYGSDYVTVDNVDVRNGHIGIVADGGDNFVIKNCNIQDMWSMGIYCVPYSNAAFNGEIAHNTITRTGWTSVYFFQVHNSWIHHNTLSYAQDTILGIAIMGKELCGVGLERGQNNLVEYNYISYMGDACFDYYYEVNTVVRYNKGFHTRAGAYPMGTGLKLYYNVFNLSGVWGGIGAQHIYDSKLSPAPDSGANEIYNNTVYNFNVYGIYSISDSDSVIYKNNLIIANSNVNLIQANSGIFNSNIYYNTKGGSGRWKWKGTNWYTLAELQITSGQDAYSVYGDPLFTDATNGKFTLKSGSPAINAGVNVGLTKDILGNPIVGNPDIGAYEYGSDIDYEIPMVT